MLSRRNNEGQLLEFGPAAPPQIGGLDSRFAAFLHHPGLPHSAAHCSRHRGQTVVPATRPRSFDPKVKINPFVLSTTVRGLLIKDKDGQPFISWDEVYVNFQLSSFPRPSLGVQGNQHDQTVRPRANEQGLHVEFLRPRRQIFDERARRRAQATPPKPLALHVGRLQISGAAASFSGSSPRASRSSATIGPLDVTLENFRTDPDNKNPYSFAGTTDAGEHFAWSGFFYLDPLRSQGELTLARLHAE